MKSEEVKKYPRNKSEEFFCQEATKKIFFEGCNKVSNSNGFIQLQEIIMGTEFYSKFVVFNKLIQHLLDFT